MSAHESEQQLVSSEDTLKPSDDARAYMLDAFQDAESFDPQEKEKRDRAKDELTGEMLKVLDAHGVKTPAEVETRYGETLQGAVRTTPMVPMQIDGIVVGVSLHDEIAAVSRFRDGTHSEEIVVGRIHLTQHDLETGEQIGRNSAAVVSSNYVNNARKGQATRHEIEAITGVVQFMNEYLSGQPAIPQPEPIAINPQ